ncbi:MAG: hypothetical protein HY815_33100 [Candidatus Riflebacteria bacterium]|nr:hypothetical protein [Candidatus Riflebacteria bacterium]
MATESSTTGPVVDAGGQTRAQSAAIENVGRFVTDSLLAPGALEDLLAHLDIPWSVLANGTQLRLLRKDTSGEPRYLQFHVETILAEEDQDAFWVFYQLLRWATLTERDGQPALLRRAIEESDRIGTGVSKALGESAHVALETFLRELYRDEANQPFLRDLLGQPGQLEDLHREGLLFLYRILFVYFAESRRLLPLDNEIYFESYSLEAWRDKLYDRHLFHPSDYYLWGVLAGLFSLIESGFDSKEIKIPPYNGGLFSRERTPILGRCRLNDQALRDVLFGLSTAKVGRTKRDQKADRVSYRELGVEQLGSVYEGLLEFEPKLASEEMVIVPIGSGKKASAQVFPRRELDRLQKNLKVDPENLEVIPQGTLYLAAWGGRRKGRGKAADGEEEPTDPMVDDQGQ